MTADTPQGRTADEYLYETTDCTVTGKKDVELDGGTRRFGLRCFAEEAPEGPKKTRKSKVGAAPDQLWGPDGKLYLVGFNGTLTKALARSGLHLDEQGVFLRRQERPALDIFTRWLPRMAYQDTLSSMVPASSWGASLHRLMTNAAWQQLRQQTFAACGNRCEFCASAAPLECHELWRYREPASSRSAGVQVLDKLVGLCSLCHETQHLGFAKIAGRLDQTLARLASMNDWTDERGALHYRDCVAAFQRRSQTHWMLDLGRLQDGLAVRPSWQLDDDLWLTTQGRTGPVITKLLAICWHIDGQEQSYATNVNVEVLRNVPKS